MVRAMRHALKGLATLIVTLATPGWLLAQGWVAPLGIPHPGDWFLKTEGNVQLVTTGGASRTFTGTGTAAAPVIFRGVNAPRFTGTVRITGSYVIVENIEVDGAQVLLTGNHLALRHSEVHNFKPGGNNTTVLVNGDDLVLYANRIHDNGEVASTVEADLHGIGGGGHRIWILDNEIYRHGGDGIQFGHNAQNTIGDIYVGRNTIHEDRENGVDIKEASNVILSQNTIYGYRPTSSSEGAAVVIHYCPINAHVLFNTIFDSEVGISASSLLSRCLNLVPYVNIRFIGNLIYRISGSAIQGWGADKVTDVVGNTLVDIDGDGIYLVNLKSGSLIENNILRHVRGADVTANPTSAATVRNNLLKPIDPLFVNPDGGDFRLRSASPAINAGVSSGVYSAFQSLFGRSIAVDIEGRARPQGGAWDLGAYEFASGSGGPPPAPSNLTVR